MRHDTRVLHDQPGTAVAGLYSPTNPSGVIPGVGQATLAGATGAAGPDIVAALAALDGLSDRGSINDRYFQEDNNWALFTHNIFHITDKLDFTFGLRYTNDKKKFAATFTNDNTVCTTVQGLVLNDLTTTTAGTPTQSATARALAGALIGLSCQGNSTAELNNVSINDKRSEDEFTGTAILSYKPIDDLMVYASYSRGYKAGGFNLDRSALKSPILPFASSGGAQALVSNLQFDPETVHDNATFDDPHQLSSGVEHVIVNGVPILKEGKPVSGALPGRYLRFGIE